MTNIESRIEALEAKLVLMSTPRERLVIIINWTSAIAGEALVDSYFDGNGHELRREPDESLESFQGRAEVWAQLEHRNDNPTLACVLYGTDRRVTAARCA